MSKDYVWYQKPGWWVFIVVAIGMLLMIATAPSPGSNHDYNFTQVTYHRPLVCYVPTPDERDMTCNNPDYQPNATRAPNAGT